MIHKNLLYTVTHFLPLIVHASITHPLVNMKGQPYAVSKTYLS